MNEPGWIGRTIGDRYQIQELIGQGGMSAVYKAYDPNLRRVVAVKLIHSHLSQDPQFVRRFEEEATAVAQMRHPSIIQVYDFNNEGKTYFIVFEFVPGESLRARLRRTLEAKRRLDLTKIVDYSATVADALDYAHSRGIIHRDIKPANVMINVHDQAILMDFGIVKIVGGDTHTATGAVLGTARYISPEQVRGESVDYRTDIYSMGVMLYETSSGRPPYEADSAITVMMMHVNDPIPDIRSARPDMPASLANVITRAMAKNRAERFQSAAELALAIRSVGSDPAISAVAGVSTVAAAAPSRVDQPVQAARPAAASQVSSREKTPPQPVPGAVPAAAVQQPVASTDSSDGNRRIAVLGGLAALLILLLCIAAAAIIYGSGILSADDEQTDADATNDAIVNNASATESAQSAGTDQSQEAGAPATIESTEIIAAESTLDPTVTTGPTPELIPTLRSTNTPHPTNEPTPTVQPTDTPHPTDEPTPTAHASNTPTPTVEPTPPSGLSVEINTIDLENGSYVVHYSPYGYTPQLPGTHIHFFFNTVPPENAGVGPTQETWFLYGGPNPFTGYGVGDRPGGATQMCALVANADHTVQLNTGNCVDLP